MQQNAPRTKHTRILWALATLLVIVIIIGIARTRSTSDAADDGATTTPTITQERTYLVAGEYPTRMPLATETAVGSAQANEIVIADQAAGDEAFLTRVALMAPGWVAVKEVGGNVLGAARFDAGVWQGNVILLRPLVAGRAYQALMYHDDGDSTFDLAKDTLVLDDDGMPVAASFEAY